MLGLFREHSGKAHDDSIARLLKLLVFEAAVVRAEKIVFGEPSEPDCRRVPWDPDALEAAARAHEPPWEAENRERFSGRTEEERADARTRIVAVPCWYRIGDTYQEHNPMPASLLVQLLSYFARWHGHSIEWEPEEPRWAGLQDSPARLAEGRTVFILLLRLEDRRLVRASLGVEPNHCFSISIDDLGKPI